MAVEVRLDEELGHLGLLALRAAGGGHHAADGSAQLLRGHVADADARSSVGAGDAAGARLRSIRVGAALRLRPEVAGRAREAVHAALVR